MVCGFLPKLGSVFASIPSSVLGGALLSVFAMITINGVKMLAQAGFSERNVLVMGITFALGLGLAGHADAIAGMPSWLTFIFEDSIAATTFIGILANLLFPNASKGEPQVAAPETAEKRVKAQSA